MAVSPADEVKAPVGPGAHIIGVNYTQDYSLLQRMCRANHDAWLNTLKALRKARKQKNALLKIVVEARRRGEVTVTDPDVLAMLKSMGER